jgi:DNA-binding NarL/FixJ family response regulator
VNGSKNILAETCLNVVALNTILAEPETPSLRLPAAAGETYRMTTVAIVEDNATIRQTLAHWINETPGYRCMTTCDTAEQALAVLPKLAPDVVLMDIQLPNLSGIACTVRLRELLPEVQIIIVTVYRDYDKIFKALQAGACGYLLKRSNREELIHAIAEVRSGGAPMSSEIARRLVESFQQTPASEPQELSRREEEILDLLCQGFSNKEIGDQLNVSIETVRSHLKRIYDRLHVRSRTEAAMKYREWRDRPPQTGHQD